VWNFLFIFISLKLFFARNITRGISALVLAKILAYQYKYVMVG